MRYPASYPSPPPEGERHYGARSSCCLSATGIGFLGHPVPAMEFGLPHGRPTGRVRTRAGFPRSTCARPGRGGCRHISRGGGVHAAGQVLPAAACRFPAASPAPRSRFHLPEAHLDETYRRFTHVHPSGLSLTYAPGWIEGRFGFYPEASHPAVTSDARPSGNGPSDTDPGYVIDDTADLLLNAPLTHATSYRTILKMPS